MDRHLTSGREKPGDPVMFVPQKWCGVNGFTPAKCEQGMKLRRIDAWFLHAYYTMKTFILQGSQRMKGEISMGLWTYNRFRIVTDKPLPNDYFGKSYVDPEMPPYRQPDGTITPKEVFEKCLNDSIAAWNYIEAHEDEYLPMCEGHTMQYKHQNKEISYTFLNETKTGYETKFGGNTPDCAAEKNMLWFVNKCKKIREDTGIEILFMHAWCESDLNGLYEYKHESIGCDKPF